MNHKTARILKLIQRGLTTEKIIRTLGHEDTEEIRKRIEKLRTSANG